MESIKNISRFEIKEQIGEGSFSKLYIAFDSKMNSNIAIKAEKQDKNKSILKFEYEVIKSLQSLNFIPRVYDFYFTPTVNFIAMEKLGKSLASYKKSKNDSLPLLQATDFLIQMLNCIEGLHNKGYIHRDIKPSNFVLDDSEKKVFMIDFGLSKLHLNEKGIPIKKRTNSDFRGTLAYASINAHHYLDLGRRDDLWSFFYVLLEMMNETLPWPRSSDKEQIEIVKKKCHDEPKNMLRTTCNRKEIFQIFSHIKGLKYESKPDYEFIRKKLKEFLIREIKDRNENVDSLQLNEVLNGNQEKSVKTKNWRESVDIGQLYKLKNENMNENLLHKKKKREIFKITKEKRQKKSDCESPLKIMKNISFELLDLDKSGRKAYINEYQEYFKIVVMCEAENSNLSSCIPVDKSVLKLQESTNNSLKSKSTRNGLDIIDL